MGIGLTWDKLLIIGIIAALLIGPERLPRYAETFARFVSRAGAYLQGAKARLRDEMGPELDDVDWRRLDPRQYDPRRIIRDALFEEPGAATAPPREPARAPEHVPGRSSAAGGPPPFDSEAT